MPNASYSTPEADAPADFGELLRTIGARARALREAQGLSIPLLAELAGVDGAAISRIEQGQKNYRLKTADHIARGIGVHTYELFIPPELSELHLREPRRRQRRASPREPVGLNEQERVFRELLEHVGSRMRELRKLQGLSLTALAHFMGVTPQAIENIEAGRTNVSIKTADRVARAIGVHTHELFIPRSRSELRYTGETPSDRPVARPRSRRGKVAKKKKGARGRRS